LSGLAPEPFSIIIEGIGEDVPFNKNKNIIFDIIN